MHARVATARISPDAVQAAQRDVVGRLETVRQMSGNQGTLVLVDREQGTVVAVSLWADEQSLRASEHSAGQVRDASAQTTGGELTGVARYEVVALDGLRATD